ncbi:MAG TPA: endonuclease MutS2, partial [Erysipelothrix sp.]|nr:endonuclease MutS2 [Erysipelothrix sp.]
MINVKERLELDKILESIATKAAFSLGKQRVLNSEPSFSSLIVKRDLKRLKAAMDLSVAFGPLSFGGIKDVSVSLDRASKMAVLSVEELVHIGQFLQGTHRLRKQYANLEENYEALDDLFYSLEDAPKLMQLIDKSFTESFEVLDNASSELKEIRRKRARMQSQIEHETAKFLNKHKDMLSEDVVALRQGRQAFLIKPGDKNKLPGSVLGTSASGQSVYFEPEFLSRLQNEHNQIIAQENEEIERICRVISLEVSKVNEQLSANLETSALLDEIFAKALWGVENEGIVANLTKDSLVLENARHPLINKDEVVANSYYLQKPHRVILISGPNTGGKSVTLKTIGLFVLLTHTGCPVLCDKAEVMMVDNVFVDIGDQQSIEKSLSSFSAHLETVSQVIDNATSNSLILLDELGSQTDPLEGEALSMAILDHFRKVGSWVVATTHFSKLKKYGTQFDDILNASVEFNLETLKPTYRYQENVLGESNALHIAKEYGISQAILDSASRYKKESTYEADNLLEIL